MRKSTHKEEYEMQQEMSQWVTFVKENSCRGIYSKTKSLFDPLVVMGFSLQGRNLVQPLHRKTSAQSDQECFFWLSRHLELVHTLSSVLDTLLFFQKLDQITQNFMLLLVSLQHNKFKQQDLVPLQMWVLLIQLCHWKPHNLCESISKYL